MEEDYLDSLKYSSANNEPLSDKYSVEVAYKNLNIVVEALRLLVSDNKDIDKTRDRAILLQKKMKEALEKMQQQKSQKELFELKRKSKEEFSKYINGTIDGVSIEKYKDLDFCKKNNIAGFLILNSNQEKTIHGFVDNERRRCYDLGTTAQYGMKFNWYVDGKERSITLGANGDGSIRVIGDRPADKDLEENKDVKIQVGDNFLSLAEAVKTCRQPNSTINKLSATESFQPLVNTP